MIHHIYANQSNVGDWLSALGIQSLLAPRRVQEHLCDAPFVEATLAALAEAGPDDFIIIGGGGLFMDYFEPFWQGFGPIAARVPYCLWGVGCCERKRARSSLPLRLMKDIVAKSRLSVVRDELTRSHLSGGGLRPPLVCPTVVAVPVTGGEEKRLLHVDHYDNVGPEIYERMDEIARAMAQRTGRHYARTNNLILPGQRAALARTLELYASADLVLSSRLHGCLIGLAMGRRVLAVSGDQKVESLMHAAGLSDWVCDLDDIGSLPARLEKLPAQRWPGEFIEEGRREHRQVAEEVLALLPAQPKERVP